jgi:hypothetical protein
MLKLLNRVIYSEKSEILLKLGLDKQEDLEHFELASGEWYIEDHSLVGLFRGNGGGICYSKESFPGDIMLDFYAEMIPPCNNDLNFVFKTEGWDYNNNDAARGFIGGLNGWYDKKAGIEKYPHCKTRALAEFSGESGREYHIQTGYIEDIAFLFVDGKLIMEMSDPEPEEFKDFGRFGLGTYCSKIRFKNLTVYRIIGEKVNQYYTPEF